METKSSMNGFDATEKMTDTTPNEATTTSSSPTNTPNTAPESTTTASTELSTRTFGNAKANTTNTASARRNQGLPCVGLIIFILLAPMVRL